MYTGDLSPTITTNKGEGVKICVDASINGKSVNNGVVERICTDLSINQPGENNISNCITAREDRGISNHKSIGNGVVEWKEKS